jgi:SAM-dependent methyltransferase
MNNNQTTSASQYFNANWKKYQHTLEANTLYHREMFAALSNFINEKFGSKAFSFVDVGCGDASIMVPVLTGKTIQHYVGIDAAPDVLHIAEANLKPVSCQKEFICDNMTTAIPNLKLPADIIFSSYAVHHLSLQQKSDFIQACQNKLNKHGYLLMVDGILKEDQIREQWLAELQQRMQATQHLTQEELEFRMQHPRADDHPERISTFAEIAHQQQWQHFDVLLQKDIFAFMVFGK